VLFRSGRVASLKEGDALAREILAAGRALEVVERMRRASHGETS
jgi:anthranilate phosphoribosyltransferase